MGNGLGLWLPGKLRTRASKRRLSLSFEAHVLLVDSTMGIDFAKYLDSFDPSLFCVIVNDGPVPTAKVKKRVRKVKAAKAPARECLRIESPWKSKVPSGLKPLINDLTKLSIERPNCCIVLSHGLVKGEADYKIAEFYRNWACSTSYTPDLNYVVVSPDSDVMLVTLGFHEKNCYWVKPDEMVGLDIGYIREFICELMGGGDVRRRVDDFIALAVFAKNDFHSGLGVAPENLIEAYKEVTGMGVFLVDDDKWNPDVLKALFTALMKQVPVSGKSATPEACEELFKYLAWGLQLYHGFCPDFDFCPPSTWPPLKALVANFDRFERAYQFSDNDPACMLPPTVLLQMQQKMPSDAPPCVSARRNDLFGGMFAKSNHKIVRKLTLVQAAQMYNDLLRDELLQCEPKVENRSYAVPWFFHKGTRRAVSLSKKDPDFESLLRIAPPFGCRVVYNGCAVGLFRDVLDDERCCIQLYFLNLADVAEGRVSAVYVGPITCALDDLEWANNVKGKGKAVEGPCVCYDALSFGVVGQAQVIGRSCRLLVSGNQFIAGGADTEELALRAVDVRPFEQLPLDEMRRLVRESAKVPSA